MKLKEDLYYQWLINPLEKEMVTHSSTLAWRIPWREEPGRLQSKIAQFHLETEKQTVES